MPFIPIVALIFEAAAYIVSPEASRLIVDVFPLLVPILAIFPEPSALLSVGVNEAGQIVASYSNGDTKKIGQIAVASFTNPSGLEKVGDNLYAATLNSGSFDGIGEDISESSGKITSGYLEMSNVDLADQFTNMITTQRGYQANSRIITVSDTMLEELINLKR